MEVTSFIIRITLTISFTIALRLPFKIPGPNSYDDRVGIVGAGPAGIHMAHLLKKKGFNNVEVLESNDRVGGKSCTFTHRGVPHEMGTVYLTPDYEKNIIDLVNKYVPGDLIDLVPASYTIDNSTNFLSVGEYAIGYGAKLLRTNNTKYIMESILEAAQRYIIVYKNLFGNFEGELMPEPNSTVKAKIKGSFMNYLQRNNMELLVPLLEGGHTFQGYGLLNEIPALYGFLWNTQKFLSSIVDRIHGNPTGGIYLLKNGFQNLWEKIVERDNITVIFNTKVTWYSRLPCYNKDKPGCLLSVVKTKNTVTNLEATRGYNFLIWTPEMKTSLSLWNEHYGKEVEYFNKTHATYFTTAVVDTRNEARGVSPCVYYTKSNHSEIYANRVTAQRDSFAALRKCTGHIYGNHTCPISKDHSNITTTVVYHMSRTKFTDNQLKQNIVNHKKFFNATNITLAKMIQWRYFPRYSTEDIESGILWRILEMQGKYGMWYTGSSVIFESAKSVAEYNDLLVENMAPIAIMGNVGLILYGNIFVLFLELLLYYLFI